MVIEQEPIPGFNIPRIASKLKGWEMSVGSNESDEPEIDSWLFKRVTPDNRYLYLAISPSKGFVRYVERLDHQIEFSIICSGIKHVDIDDSDITFRGNFHYKIWSDGMFHEVRLDANTSPIVERSYDFKGIS